MKKIALLIYFVLITIQLFAQSPVISSFAPASGGVDATITITGTNFIGATAVTIGGVAANSFTVVNSTTITAVTNSGFATGVITVVNGATATSANNFTRTSCANTITALVATPTTDANGFAGFDVSWNLGAGTYTAINVFYQPQTGAGSTYFTRRSFAGTATSGRIHQVNGAGITYNIYVQGVCSGNAERVSTTAITGSGNSCSIITLAATPLVVSGTDITFTWNTVPNAYLYQPIYQECDAAGNRVAGGQGSTAYLTPNSHPSTQSWTASQLKPNTFYRFAVRTHCIQGDQTNVISPYSLYPFIQTSSGAACVAPIPTLGTSGTTNGYASQVINWASVPSATNGYGISFRESTQASATTYHLGNVTSYTISGLKQGSTYIYSVYGACSNGQNPRSADATFTAGTGQTYDCNAATINASTSFSNPVGVGLSWTSTPTMPQVGRVYVLQYTDTSNPTVTNTVYPDSTKISLFVGIHAGILPNKTYTYNLYTHCDGNRQWGTTGSFNTMNLPTITSFTPTSGGVDQTVTITGTNFTGATAVTIGGVAANSFTVVNSTTITAVTNSGFATGAITVTNGGVATSATNFTRIACANNLAITSITPSIDANGFGGFDLVFTNTGTYMNVIVAYKPTSSSVYTRRVFAGSPTSARISQIEGNGVPYDLYIQGQCAGFINSDRVAGTATSPASGNTCATPVGNVITPTGTTVTFTWNAVANVHQYQPRYQELTSTLAVISNTGTTVTLPAGTTTWTVPQLKPNTNYRFTVRTLCDNGNVISPWADFQYVLTTSGAACLPPLPVTAITGTTNGYASANITWTAPVDVPTGSPKYSLIYRNTAKAEHFSVQTDNLNYNLAGLQQGATYEYKVVTQCTNTLASVASPSQTFVATSGQTNNCNFITNLSATAMNSPLGTRLTWTILPSGVQAGRTFSVHYWKLSEPNTIHSVVTDNTTIDLQVGSNNIIADTDYGYRILVYCNGTLNSYSDTGNFSTNDCSLGTTYTWVGGTSTDWNEGTNWFPNGVPTSTSKVILNAVTQYPSINAGVTVTIGEIYATGSTILGNGTLVLSCAESKFENATITPKVKAEASIHSAVTKVMILSSIFEDNVTLEVPYLSYCSSQFKGTTNTFTHTYDQSATNTYSNYSNTFGKDANSTTTIANIGNAGLRFDYMNPSWLPSIVNGKLILDNRSTGGINWAFSNLSGTNNYYLTGDVELRNTNTGSISFRNEAEPATNWSTLAAGVSNATTLTFTRLPIMHSNYIKGGLRFTNSIFLDTNPFVFDNKEIVAYYTNCTFNGDVNLSGDTFSYVHSVFNGINTAFTHNNYLRHYTDYDYFSNIFGKDAGSTTTITNTSAGAHLHFDYMDSSWEPSIVNGKLILDNKGTGHINWAFSNLSGNRPYVLTGDVELRNADIPGSGSISFRWMAGVPLHFKGNIFVKDMRNTPSIKFNEFTPFYISNPNTLQTISSYTGSQPLVFPLLILDKPNSILHLESIVKIKNRMTFTSGIVTTGTNAYVDFLDGAKPENAGDNSFVAGRVGTPGVSYYYFVFPIGKLDGVTKLYRPLIINPVANPNSHYIAEYFHTDATSLYPVSSPAIQDINHCFYWSLSSTLGSSPIKVGVVWDNSSACSFTPIPTTKMVIWDDSQWVSMGQNAPLAANYLASGLPFASSKAITLGEAIDCPNPSITVSLGTDKPFVNPTALTATVTNSIGNETYQWFKLPSTVAIPTAINSTFDATEPGTYQVNVSTACGVATSTVTLSAPVGSDPDLTLCKYTFTGEGKNGFDGILNPSLSYFGRGVAEIGDIDGDEVVDMGVVSHNECTDEVCNTAGGRGALWILFMNADGTVKSYKKTNNERSIFGFRPVAGNPDGTSGDFERVIGIGDRDGNNVPDIVVAGRQHHVGGGQPGEQNGGFTIVLLNSDGSVKQTYLMDGFFINGCASWQRFSRFGDQLSTISDLDGDGHRELVVSAAFKYGNPSYSYYNNGQVFILSLKFANSAATNVCGVSGGQALIPSGTGFNDTHFYIQRSFSLLLGTVPAWNHGVKTMEVRQPDNSIVELLVGLPDVGFPATEPVGITRIYRIPKDIFTRLNTSGTTLINNRNVSIQLATNASLSNNIVYSANGAVFNFTTISPTDASGQKIGIGRGFSSLGDINGDGRDEILMSSDEQGSVGGGLQGKLYIMYLKTDGTLDKYQAIAKNLPTTYTQSPYPDIEIVNPNAFATGSTKDINADGIEDGGLGAISTSGIKVAHVTGTQDGKRGFYTLYFCAPPKDCATNLELNGAFNNTTGFTSEFTSVTPPSGALSDATINYYSIVDNPNLLDNSFCPAPTSLAPSAISGTKMLVGRGSTTEAKILWKNTYTLLANTSYRFSFATARLSTQVNYEVLDETNTVVGMIDNTLLPTSCEWKTFTLNFTTTASTTKTFTIKSTVIGAANNIAIDDISLRVVTTVSLGTNRLFVNPTVLTASITGATGTETYQWFKAPSTVPFATTPTPMLSVTEAGEYSIKVTNSCGSVTAKVVLYYCAAPATLRIVTDYNPSTWKSSISQNRADTDWTQINFNDDDWTPCAGVTNGQNAIMFNYGQVPILNPQLDAYNIWPNPSFVQPISSWDGAWNSGFMRRTFNIDGIPNTTPGTSNLRLRIDDATDVYINGTKVFSGRSTTYEENDPNCFYCVIHSIDLSPYLVSGKNVIAIYALSEGGPYRVQADVDITYTTYITSNEPIAVSLGANTNFVNPTLLTATTTGVTANKTYRWFKAPSTIPILGASNSTLMVTQAGQYTVEVSTPCTTGTSTITLLENFGICSVVKPTISISKDYTPIAYNSEKVDLVVFTECAKKIIESINQISVLNQIPSDRILSNANGNNAGISTTAFLPIGCAFGNNTHPLGQGFSPVLVHRYYDDSFISGNNFVNLLWLKASDVTMATDRNMNIPLPFNTVTYNNYQINFNPTNPLNIGNINPYVGYRSNVPVLTTLEALKPDGLNVLFSDVNGSSSTNGSLSLEPTPSNNLVTWQEVISVSKIGICAGESLTLTVDANYETYAWYRNGEDLGMSDKHLTISLSGIYTLVVTGIGGCKTSTHIVVENSCPAAPCEPEEVTSFNHKENSRWILGSQGGINFNLPIPALFKDNTNLEAIEGVTTMSNDGGDLLFYTDGQNVWDATHTVVTTLLGDPTKGTMILKNPNSFTNSYYIFTNQGGNLYYSLVGSDGKIFGTPIDTKHNVLLATNISQKITATYHINGKDLLLICMNDIPKLLIYKITSNGVSNTPLYTKDSNLPYDIGGILKVSPDGSKLVNLVKGSGIEVFKLSISSGELEHFFTWNNPAIEEGVEFSPASNFLYVASNSIIYQVPLNQVNPLNYVNPMYNIGGSGGAMHLAIDGQIYTNRGSNYSLPYIALPNEIKYYSSNSLNALDLSALGTNNFNTVSSLQNQITSYYPCQLFDLSYNQSNVTTFEIVSNMGNNPNISYEWYKDGIKLTSTLLATLNGVLSEGDSKLTIPTSEIGIYTVVMQLGCICYATKEILVKNIETPTICVNTVPIFKPLNVCGTTQTFKVFFDSEFCLFGPHRWNLITWVDQTEIMLASFSTLNLGSDCSIELSLQNTVLGYTFFRNANGACSVPVTVDFFDRTNSITITPKLDCSGYTLSTNDADSYLWSVAESTPDLTGAVNEQSIEIGTTGGTYYVDVVIGSCSTRLTKVVPALEPLIRDIKAEYICLPAAPAVDFVPATATTPAQSAIPAMPERIAMKLSVVDANGVPVTVGDSYYWSTGETIANNIIVEYASTYWVSITNGNSCPKFLVYDVKFPQLGITATPNSNCSSYVLTAPEGFANYEWKFKNRNDQPIDLSVLSGVTGLGTNEITIVTAAFDIYGTYTVTASPQIPGTSSLGCLQEASVTILPKRIITPVPVGYGSMDNVLSVSASTFSNQWLRTQSTSIVSESGWGNGRLGTWRPQATFQYIRNRKREGITNGDGTVIISATPLTPFLTPDLKTDGVFSLSMFNWKANGVAVCDSWLKTQHITQYDRLGQEIENKDILNRHTAALYGYNGLLPVATAGNAKVDEIAFESFEEYKAPILPSVAPITGYDLPENNMDLITSIPVISSNLATNYQWLSTNGATFDGTTYVAWIDGIVLQDMTTLSASNTQNMIIKGYSLNPNKTGIFQGKPTSVAIAHQGNRTRLTITMAAFFTIDGSPVLAANKFNWNGEIGIERIEQLVVASTTTTATISTEHKHTGKQSIKFVSNSAVFAQFTPKRLNPIIGRKYIVSAWVKLATSITTNLSQPRKSNYDNLNLVDNPSPGASYRSNDIEGWVRIEQEVLPNPTNGDIELKFSKITPDNFDVLYVDDIRIHPADASIQTYVYDAKNYKLRATLDGNNFASLYFYDEQGNLYLTKKETERGIQTIQESLSHQPKK